MERRVDPVAGDAWFLIPSELHLLTSWSLVVTFYLCHGFLTLVARWKEMPNFGGASRCLKKELVAAHEHFFCSPPRNS